MKMSYFFDANFMNAKNCKIWHFLKYQFFRFFIISPIIFDLQECNIPQIKAKDILFWPHFFRYLAKINTLWDRKQWSCLIFFTQTLVVNLNFHQIYTWIHWRPLSRIGISTGRSTTRRARRPLWRLWLRSRWPDWIALRSWWPPWRPTWRGTWWTTGAKTL